MVALTIYLEGNMSTKFHDNPANTSCKTTNINLIVLRGKFRGSLKDLPLHGSMTYAERIPQSKHKSSPSSKHIWLILPQSKVEKYTSSSFTLRHSHLLKARQPASLFPPICACQATQSFTHHTSNTSKCSEGTIKNHLQIHTPEIDTVIAPSWIPPACGPPSNETWIMWAKQTKW